MRTSSAAFLLCLALAACGSAGKPASDQIGRYLGDQLPPYLSIQAISTSFEPISILGGAKLPSGSWRIATAFKLRAGEDLYAITPEADALRNAFSAAVSKAEAFRVGRIQAVEAYATKLGLLKDRGLGPLPAFPVSLATRKGGELADEVTLLAQPAGTGWKFVQLGPQSLDTSRVGEPLVALRADNPKLTLVLQGSDEERDFRDRQTNFLSALKRLPPP